MWSGPRVRVSIRVSINVRGWLGLVMADYLISMEHIERSVQKDMNVSVRTSRRWRICPSVCWPFLLLYRSWRSSSAAERSAAVHDSSLLPRPTTRLTLFLHGVCMLCECICGECAHGQHVRRTLTLTLTLTLTHTINAVLSRWKCHTCAHTHMCNQTKAV